MSEDSLALYFAEREQRERSLSHSSRNWRVAAIHTELADRYEALALVFGARRPGGINP